MDLLIKPCPFCGGVAKLDSCKGDRYVNGGEPFFWVAHRNEGCPIRIDNGSLDVTDGGMETRYHITAEDAANAWNRRACE